MANSILAIIPDLLIYSSLILDIHDCPKQEVNARLNVTFLSRVKATAFAFASIRTNTNCLRQLVTFH